MMTKSRQSSPDARLGGNKPPRKEQKMKLKTKVNVGDIKRLPNPRGEDFIVRVLKVFDYEGEEWAEVKPVDFNGISREIKACMLFD